MNSHIKTQAKNPFIYDLLVYLFLFSALVVPEQIKFTSIPGVGGLTISRFLLIVLLPFFLIRITKIPIMVNERKIVFFSLAFVSFCFISIIYNNSSLKWVLYFIENFILTGLIFLTVFKGIKDYKFLIFIISSILFINIFGLYEFLTGEVLYSASIVFEDQYTANIIDGQYRGFQRRNQSVFQNAYSLAIHAMMFLIFLIGSYKSQKISFFMRAFVWINIVILLFIIFQSNVRLIIFLSIIFLLYEFFYKTFRRYPLLIILTIFLLISLNIVDAIVYFYELFFTQNSHINSIFARLSQFEVFGSFINNVNILILGLGPGGATEEFYKFGLLAIDNMYLSVLLETGVSGLLFFLIPYMIIFRLSVRYYDFSNTINYFTFLIISILIIFLFNASKEPFAIYSIVTYGFLRELYLSKIGHNI